MRDMSPAYLGCPQHHAKNQDGKTLVGFRPILDDVCIHQQDQDDNHDDKTLLHFNAKVPSGVRILTMPASSS